MHTNTLWPRCGEPLLTAVSSPPAEAASPACMLGEVSKPISNILFEFRTREKFLAEPFVRAVSLKEPHGLAEAPPSPFSALTLLSTPPVPGPQARWRCCLLWLLYRAYGRHVPHRFRPAFCRAADVSQAAPIRGRRVQP